MTTWTLVGDLHLGAVRSEPATRCDEGFRALASELAALDAPRLVLLGDTFDLLAVGRRRGAPDPSPTAAIASLDVLAAEHPDVVDGLRHLLAAGGELHLVVGNHDLELMVPAVQVHLRALLADRADSRNLHVHPWFLLVPGVLYAEHGHQHHDINTVDALLAPQVGAAVALPLASYIPHGRRADGALLRLTLAAARTAPILRARRRRRYRRRVLPAVAPSLGVPAATALALDALARPSWTSAGARMAGRRLGRLRRAQRGGYMHRAARRIDEVLRRDGLGASVYAFGHTHLAETFPLVAGTDAPVYLNPGTWSPFAPPGVAPALTYAQVIEDGGRVRASVLRWADLSRLGAPAPPPLARH